MTSVPEDTAHRAANIVLVTGGTGLIGSAVAVALLGRPHVVHPLFLVRAPDRRAGLQRLRERIALMDPEPAVLARLSEEMIVCGDLSGFAAHCGDSRIRSVTHVLHAAALASFAWRPEISRVNVDATLAFSRSVATLPAVRRFMYVGTAMISGDTRDCEVHEDDFPAVVRQFVPYTKSKAESERRLPEALGGLPLHVARPSIVVGHTRLGCVPSPSIFWIFRMIHAAGRTPFPPAYRIDVIPVDYCARALVHVMLKPMLAHKCYHVSAGRAASCTFSEIERCYSALDPAGHRGELVEFPIERLSKLEPRFPMWFGPCNARQMSSAVRLYRNFAGLNVTFDNRRLLAEGMKPPPRFTDYLAACVRSRPGESIVDQMRTDFELHGDGQAHSVS